MRSLNSMNSWCKKAIQALGGALVILLLSVPAFSQGNAGRVMGTVTDQSGGVVAGATVSVVDTQRGTTRTLITDDAGEYNAPNLTPSTYTVRAEAKGFKRLERQNVDVGVGKEVRVDLTVQPGEQAQTVTVTEAIPLVETTNATLGGTLNNADISDMPLNGRNYQSLLGLRPGVMIQPGGGPWTQSTNGVRPDESVWMIDGVINQNFFDARPIVGMPSPITDGATILPIDAIQEFNLMENPKAEYGWHPGAQVNVGIKSGTNGFHGSAYGFYRSAAWDARNYVNPAPQPGLANVDPFNAQGCAYALCDKLPTQLKQFGGVIGGPIIKDKLFFFGAYEGLRSLIGNALTGHAPQTVGNATLAPGDSMVDAIIALQNADIAVSPVSLALTGCTTGVTPSCTGGYFANNQLTTGLLSTLPNTNVSNNGVGKIDYHINPKNSLNGVLVIGDYVGSGEDHPFVNPVFLNTFIIKTYTTSASWISTPTSNLVNEARFGYNRMTFTTGSLDAGISVPGLDTGLTVPGLPMIDIARTDPSHTFTRFGTWHNRPQNTSPNPYYDLMESVSYLKGKHTFKFGFEFAHIEADSYVPDYGRGLITFGGGATAGLTDCGGVSCGLEDFFAGNPTGGKVLVGNPDRRMTFTTTAGYVQDDWRVSPKVTVNVGMRYEYKSPIKEVNNNWANFDPTSVTGLVQQGHGVDSMWKPDHNDFSPRVGFAWDTNGKGTTVVRGGFSMIYSTYSAVMWMNQNQFQNSSAVSLAANPTGADLITCPVLTCQDPMNAGYLTQVVTPGSGNIQVKAANVSLGPSNWGAGNQVFPPVVGNIQCGDGVKVKDGAGTTLLKDPGPCSLLAVDPNLRTPSVINYSLGVQHQFGSNLSLDIGYVGNHGSKLTGFRDINQPNPTTGIQPYAAAFPWLGYINYMANSVRSNYNSLQTTLTKRMSHGLSFTGGYTYGHTLDNGSLNRFQLLPQNNYNPGAEYASGDFDIRHRLTVTATYNIPGIKGYAQLLEGWQLNTIVNVQSGQPWTVNDGGNNFSGSGESADRWNFSGNTADFKGTWNSIPYCTGFTVNPDGSPNASGASCSVTGGQNQNTYAVPSVNPSACLSAADPTTLAAGGCFVSGTSVMTPPAAGQFGTMGRNIFRDSGFKTVDLSIFKNFTYKERYGAQFRLEIFNLANHPIPSNPYGASNGSSGGNNDPSAGANFGGAIGTPDIVAGNPVVGSGSSRAVQVGLKLTF